MVFSLRFKCWFEVIWGIFSSSSTRSRFFNCLILSCPIFICAFMASSMDRALLIFGLLIILNFLAAETFSFYFSRLGLSIGDIIYVLAWLVRLNFLASETVSS